MIISSIGTITTISIVIPMSSPPTTTTTTTTTPPTTPPPLNNCNNDYYCYYCFIAYLYRTFEHTGRFPGVGPVQEQSQGRPACGSSHTPGASNLLL